MQCILLVNVTSQNILLNPVKIYYKLKTSLYAILSVHLTWPSLSSNIVLSTPAPEVVQDGFLLVKDARKSFILKEN